MLIPLRTEIDSRRPTIVTPALIAINGAVLLALLLGDRFQSFSAERLLEQLALRRTGFRWWQPITYQFVHDLGSLWHLLFNMLFLWVFGSAVEGRLGRLGFLAFYLVGGAIAGLAHLATSVNPVIGASGAVSGCCGAFLALFPRAHVKVLFFFILVGVMSVPAALFIGLYMAIDVVMQFSSWLGTNRQPVAYVAHLAGYAYGFFVCFTLLATRVVPRQDFDVFFLFTQARRRRAMRDAVLESQRASKVLRRDAAPALGSADGAARLDPASGRRNARDATAVPPPPPHATSWESHEAPAPASPEALRHRAAIDAAFARLDVSAAAEAYLALLAASPETILPESRQLDVANQLLSDGRDAQAAHAYERFLSAYPRGHRADEARLLLATIWTRRIPEPSKARPLLEALRPRLRNAAHRALAEQLLLELPT